MYLMYVDESGDIGMTGSPTAYFALASIVVHESRWREFIDRLIAFRKTMRSVYGLPLRTEIHASHFVRKPPVPGMPRHVRLAIMRNLLDELAKINFISITTVVIRKSGKSSTYDVFGNAWQLLFQRFENTLLYGNFPGGYNADYGMVITDNTDGMKLLRMVRKMAVVNFVPNAVSLYGMGSGSRNLPMKRIIEDPNARDSQYSYLIQACDVVAYFLMQRFTPNHYIRRMAAHHYFDRLGPVLNLKASRTNALGIVTL